MKSETNALKIAVIQTADPVKEKIVFCYYRLAKGISGILSYAKEGVRLWFRTFGITVCGNSSLGDNDNVFCTKKHRGIICPCAFLFVSAASAQTRAAYLLPSALC